MSAPAFDRRAYQAAYERRVNVQLRDLSATLPERHAIGCSCSLECELLQMRRRSLVRRALRVHGVGPQTAQNCAAKEAATMNQVPLNEGEIATLEAPPDSHRLTLDGWSRIAALRGHVALYDVEGEGMRTVDPAELHALGWVS